MDVAQVPAKQNVPKDQNLQAGLAARELAVRLLAGVLIDGRPLEQVLAEVVRGAALLWPGGAGPGAGAGGGGHRAAPAGRAGARARRLPGAAVAARPGPPVADPARRCCPARLPRHGPARRRRPRRRDDPPRSRRAPLCQARQRRAEARCRAWAGRCSPIRTACASTCRIGCGKAGARPTGRKPRAASPRPACARRPSTSAPRATPPAGPSGSAAACCPPARYASPRMAASRTLPATPRAPGGCRMRAPRWWRASPATSPTAGLPTCAPRPAARRQRSQRPAPRSRPSTYRPRGSIACATT